MYIDRNPNAILPKIPIAKPSTLTTTTASKIRNIINNTIYVIDLNNKVNHILINIKSINEELNIQHIIFIVWIIELI